MYNPKSTSILQIKGFHSQFLNRVMFTFLSSIWVLLSSFFFHLLKFLSRSQEVDEIDSKISNNCRDIGSQQEDQLVLKNSVETESSMFSEDETSKLSFGFIFQTGRDYYSSFDETGDSVLSKSGLSISTSNYKFISGKDVGGFIKEPQAMSFTLQEVFVGSAENLFDENENQMKSELFARSDENLFDKNKNQMKSELFVGSAENLFDENENQMKSELFARSDENLFDKNKNQMKSELFVGSAENLFDENENQMKSELFARSDENLFDKNENQMKSELFARSDEDSLDKNEKIDGKIIPSSELREKLVQDSNCFTSDDDHQKVVDVDFAMKEETECSVINECILEKNYSHSESSSSCGELKFETQNILDGSDELGPNISISMDENKEEFFEKVLRFEDELEESDDEYIELEPNSRILLKDSAELGKNTHIEENELSGLGKHEDEQRSVKEEKEWGFDYDDQEDEEGNDILFEHEELIEQMKIEMKNLRTGGLPTILEDCETPKVQGDLKPLKIDEKFELSDQMAEIQKFYKSYAEKMRKLDILNYQTMHAINFLQLKDSSHSLSHKSSSSANKSPLLYWPGKLRKIYADPTLKSNFELQRDLEVVYVGQICLSWEILHWQHRKAINLIEFEQGKRSYNKVAGEFQQFQVLLQRFIEDEKYNGPRITNYVKSRSLVRSLLQVPQVKDDCLKEKRKEAEEEEYEISVSMLADIIEESMRVFWDLIRSDRDAANVSINGIQASADTDLLTEIKTSLQKKEKRLKDIMRSGNCIVKKFQKQGGRIFDREMLVSQVELKLISRVLNMSKLSNDQLIWCQTKLQNINIANRIVHLDPSFLLFPC